MRSQAETQALYNWLVPGWAPDGQPVFDPETDHTYQEAKWGRVDHWYVARRRWHDSQDSLV